MMTAAERLRPHQVLLIGAALAVGRMGGTGEQYSGDIFIAFSTGNRGLPPYSPDEGDQISDPELEVRMLAPHLLNLMFDLAIEATEEAIVNALVAAQTMTGLGGVTAHAIDHGLLKDAMGVTASPPNGRRDRP